MLTAAVDGRRLTLTAAPSFAAKWLVPRLGKFEELNPQVDVWLSAGLELVDLTAGEVDVAIRYGAGRYPGLEVRRLIGETVVPVLSPELHASNPLNSPADLLGHILLHDGSPEPDDSCPDWTAWRWPSAPWPRPTWTPAAWSHRCRSRRRSTSPITSSTPRPRAACPR